jgi:uncharacterized phage-associated protein
MTSAIDVAAVIRSKGHTDDWKVQKLVYYCQAWSLVWDGVPLFNEEIQAWRDGPVCPAVRNAGWAGDTTVLSQRQLDTVGAVLSLYGAKSRDWLINLTHRERPWIEARGGALPHERTNAEITAQAMKSFYAPFAQSKSFSDAYREELEFLAHEPEGLPPPESDPTVDGSSFLRWLEVGDGSPWLADPRALSAG